MNKNAKLLAEFTEFCLENPNLRFWQALLNWGRFNKITVTRLVCDFQDTEDPYYWENKDN